MYMYMFLKIIIEKEIMNFERMWGNGAEWRKTMGGLNDASTVFMNKIIKKLTLKENVLQIWLFS